MPLITLLRLCQAQHVLGTIVSIVRSSRRVTAFGPETHPSYLHLSFHPAATREPDGLCGNQRYRRELLTMGTMVPEAR